MGEGHGDGVNDPWGPLGKSKTQQTDDLAMDALVEAMTKTI
jgi:hypothetical protein